MTPPSVAQKRHRHRGERAGLSRDAVARAAVTLADATGSERFSVRLLAAHLGVDPMAIHYWFSGREKLLDAMATAALESVDDPDPASGAWDENIRRAFLNIWRSVHEHPGVEWTARRLHATPQVERALRLTVDSLGAQGLPDRDAASAALALLDLVAAAGGTSRLDEASEAAAAEGSGLGELAFLLHRSAAERFRSDLSLLMDGIRMRLLERRIAAGER